MKAIYPTALAIVTTLADASMMRGGGMMRGGMQGMGGGQHMGWTHGDTNASEQHCPQMQELMTTYCPDFECFDGDYSCNTWLESMASMGTAVRQQTALDCMCCQEDEGLSQMHAGISEEQAAVLLARIMKAEPGMETEGAYLEFAEDAACHRESLSALAIAALGVVFLV